MDYWQNKHIIMEELDRQNLKVKNLESKITDLEDFLKSKGTDLEEYFKKKETT